MLEQLRNFLVSISNLVCLIPLYLIHLLTLNINYAAHSILYTPTSRMLEISAAILLYAIYSYCSISNVIALYALIASTPIMLLLTNALLATTVFSTLFYAAKLLSDHIEYLHTEAKFSDFHFYIKAFEEYNAIRIIGENSIKNELRSCYQGIIHFLKALLDIILIPFSIIISLSLTLLYPIVAFLDHLSGTNDAWGLLHTPSEAFERISPSYNSFHNTVTNILHYITAALSYTIGILPLCIINFSRIVARTIQIEKGIPYVIPNTNILTATWDITKRQINEFVIAIGHILRSSDLGPETANENRRIDRHNPIYNFVLQLDTAAIPISTIVLSVLIFNLITPALIPIIAPYATYALTVVGAISLASMNTSQHKSMLENSGVVAICSIYAAGTCYLIAQNSISFAFAPYMLGIILTIASATIASTIIFKAFKLLANAITSNLFSNDSIVNITKQEYRLFIYSFWRDVDNYMRSRIIENTENTTHLNQAEVEAIIRSNNPSKSERISTQVGQGVEVEAYGELFPEATLVAIAYENGDIAHGVYAREQFIPVASIFPPGLLPNTVETDAVAQPATQDYTLAQTEEDIRDDEAMAQRLAREEGAANQQNLF